MIKVVIIDAYAIIYRAYYALMHRPMRNSKGMDTSVIYGFLKTIFEVQNKLHPTHFVVAFDVSGKTFRHDLFSDYKANRQETPEVIKYSVPLIKEIMAAMNISMEELAGFEADDIAGTIVKYVETQQGLSYLVTPDKDYAQLVSPTTFIYKPPRGQGGYEILGVQEICQKYEIDTPRQIRDLLVLCGDSSDNVPGITGVGVKTAAKLIRQYGTIATLVDNLHQLSPKLQATFEKEKVNLALIEKLITIDTDVPISLNLDKWRVRIPNVKRVKEMFLEYEFRSLLPEITKHDNAGKQLSLFDENQVVENSPSQISKVESNSLCNYEEVNSMEDFRKWVALQNNPEVLSIYIDFQNEDKFAPILHSIAFSCVKNSAVSVLCKNLSIEAQKKLLQPIFPLLENPTITKISNRSKQLLEYCQVLNLNFRGVCEDTMLMYYVLDAEKRFDLTLLATNLLDHALSGVSTSKEAEFADINLQVYFKLRQEINMNQLTNLYENIELPLVQVLANMELEGIRVDQSLLEETGEILNKELTDLELKIKELAQEPSVNLYSPKQLGELLFIKLGIDSKAKVTGKNKQYSTSEETLQLYSDKHPVIPMILEMRHLKKILSTYVDAFPLLINSQTRRIHTTFNQTVVATGRLSSTNPNLQNIPIRDPRSQIIRRAFVPRNSEYLLLSADYSQIELRIMAHLSNDTTMIDAFTLNQDIHIATASKIYHIDAENITQEQRRQAKVANFGIIYGISAFGLAQRLNISRTESKQLIENYFRTFPNVQKYITTVIEQAKNKGYVETLYGRKRFLHDILSHNAVVRSFAERNAVNAPIQGTAADIIKMAMINIHHELNANAMKSKMLLQVHDELLFDVHRSELDTMKVMIKQEMENAVKLSVPLTVEIGVGNNWLEAH